MNFADLLRRAEHPGTPGTGPLPRLAEIEHAQSELLAAKNKFEEDLSRNPSDLDRATSGINAYFNQLSMLTSVRIALRLPINPQWSENYALAVPTSVLGELPGLAAPQTSRTGEHYFNLVVSSSDAKESRLRLSQSHIEGLELSHLAQNPNQDAYLTLVQFLVSRQLLKNHATVESLRSIPSEKPASVSPRLIQKLQSLGLSSMIEEEERRADLEERARDQLETLIDQGSFGSAVNNELCSALTRDIDASGSFAEPLCEALRAFEAKNFRDTVKKEFSSMPLLFSAPIPSSAKLASLREIISNARAQTQIEALSEIEAQAGQQWSLERKQAIFATIEKNRVHYASELQAGEKLKLLLERARAQVSSRAQTEQKRKEFISALVKSAPEISKKTREAQAGAHVLPAALVRAFAKKLTKLNPEDSVRGIVYQLSQDPDYATARARLIQNLVQLTDASVLASAQPQAPADPRKLDDFLHHSSFMPVISFQHSRRFGDLVAGNMAQDTRGEIEQLAQIGQWMGFFGSALDPTVAQVFPAAKDERNYYTALSQELMSRYPILNLQLSGKSLHELLTSEPTHAEHWIELALGEQEQLISRQIEKVGEAKNLHDLEAVVTQSVLLQSALSGYPEFDRVEQMYTDALTRPDFAQQALRKYIDPSVAWGFGAIMLMQGTKFIFKKSSPWINAALTGLSPFIQAFTRYAVVSMVADGVYELNQVRRAKSDRDEIDGLYRASTPGGVFFDEGEVHAANSAYRWSVGMFIGHTALNALLIFRPMVLDLVKEVRSPIHPEELAGDIEAFRKLGLRVGDWDNVDARMDVLKHTRVATSPEAWEELENAASRLKIRIRANEIWHPTLTPAFRKAVHALSGRSGE